MEDQNGEQGQNAGPATMEPQADTFPAVSPLQELFSGDALGCHLEEEMLDEEGGDSVGPLPLQGGASRKTPLDASLRHLVLLLDASGSMRTVDVASAEGHIARLEAAVLCAADFAVAHAHGRPQDLFSLVTFNEDVEVLAQLQSSRGLAQAVESSAIRGNQGTFYRPALAAAAELLACTPEAEAHIVLLSDGGPADVKGTLQFFQRHLTGDVKRSKGFHLHGIGFGGTVESFAPLQQLACISGGTFSLAGCSVRSLYAAFSSVSAIITTNSSRRRHEAEPIRRLRQADYEAPELGVFGKNGVLRFRADRSSFRFDGAAFEEQSWPAAEVMRRTRPYMCGGMRLVYGFRDSTVDASENSWMVAKCSRYLEEALNSRDAVTAHAKSTAVARHFAARFNDILRTTPDSDAAKKNAGASSPTMFFVPCYVYSLDVKISGGSGPLDSNDIPCCFSGERYLPGAFLKYNSNNGYVAEAPSLRHCEVLQAFLHFSLEASGFRMLVADLQGVAREADVLLTDPQVLSLTKDFGPGDLGPSGMRACLAAHRCGPTCRRLGLRPVNASLLRRLAGLADKGDAPRRPHIEPRPASSDWERLSNHELVEYALSDARSSQASASSWVHLLDT